MNGNESTSVRNLHLNLGEVFYLIAKRHGAAPAERFLSDLPMMPIQAVVPDRKLILDAARLKSRFPISYADAFAVETARQQKAALVTGDPELLRPFQTRARRAPMGGRETAPLSQPTKVREHST
jgi:ribonuclease VapC